MRGPEFTALSLGLLIVCAQMARADEITTVRRETVTTTPSAIVAPMPVILVPGDMGITTTTTTTSAAPEPDMSRTVIMSSQRVPASTTVILTEEQRRLNEDYARRLAALNTQINLGLQKGFISQAEADRLCSEQADLSNFESQVRMEGFPKFDSDMLEKRINVFNEKVSNILTDGMKTAGAGIQQ